VEPRPPSQVIISESQRQAIFDHCLSKRPEEACGLVAGREGRVEKIYFTENVERENKRIRYEIDPSELLRIFREVEDDDLELIGIFHSHVESEAKPSATDIRKSYYPDQVYFLVSLKEIPAELRAWQIVKQRIDDESGELKPVRLVIESD
jgi:[CysO sulfur-carrier protein]-S-L-cysteine hydrolase